MIRYVIAILVMLANISFLVFGALTGREWLAAITAIGIVGGGLYLNRAS